MLTHTHTHTHTHSHTHTHTLRVAEEADVVLIENESNTRIVSGKAAAMAAEATAAKERAVVPLEERIEQFKQMLKETDVSSNKPNHRYNDVLVYYTHYYVILIYYMHYYFIRIYYMHYYFILIYYMHYYFILIYYIIFFLLYHSYLRYHIFLLYYS